MPVNTLEKRFTDYPKEPTINQDYNHSKGNNTITNLDRLDTYNVQSSGGSDADDDDTEKPSFMKTLLNGITSLLSFSKENITSSTGIIYTGLALLVIVLLYSVFSKII